MSGTQHNLCKKCYGECRPSKAFQYTLLETCDPQGNPEGIFIRQGPAMLVECMKCKKCGHSFVPKEVHIDDQTLKQWNL